MNHGTNCMHRLLFGHHVCLVIIVPYHIFICGMLRIGKNVIISKSECREWAQCMFYHNTALFLFLMHTFGNTDNLCFVFIYITSNKTYGSSILDITSHRIIGGCMIVRIEVKLSQMQRYLTRPQLPLHKHTKITKYKYIENNHAHAHTVAQEID
ncbi:hypothetical protein ACJX0J_007182 [Zea mays]